MKRLPIFLFAFLATTVFADTAVSFTSPMQQTTLLELYTSEGCSSCPPADKWLSTLKDHPRLWKEIIPVAFHVDYWDYLGWKDKFSRAEYTQRQRNFARFHHLKTIYTPGFLRNGKEWRPWFNQRTLSPTLDKPVGRLSVTIHNGMASATFKPTGVINGPLLLNIAWLGFDLHTAVHRGENRGKLLRHDFVSLALTTRTASANGDTYHWEFATDTKMNDLPEKKGIAVWVSKGTNPLPIQSTGGWL